MVLGQQSASEGLSEGAAVAGRYRVQSALGRGAAGAVYRVHDERSGALLALKRLEAPAAQRALFAAQFEREYHTLCQLAHPSIIEVYDFGIDGVQAGGGAFYTMELLEGPELRKLCPLPWKQACELLRDVASSLAVLHSRRLLHRDISLRNVRLTTQGRAKLLDFGAMTAMGPCKHAVGTPPFVPPEALALQALDARADLYSLGALAYYMLTRRYPYPARTFRELQTAFAQAPAPLGELVPELPPALVALVEQLLQLDRELRASSAAEVMERLSGIAGLPLREHAEVTRAYLATPALAGRERAQHHLDATLRASDEGGSCLLIEGAAGVGRSRMLDAAVLRAKLLGMAVARGDAGDGGGRPYGLMRALCAQLFELLPEPALRQAALQQTALAQVIDVPGCPPPPAEPTIERRHLHAALRDFVRALARSHAIAIAVDDVELVDEPSAALLAALCHGAAKRKLAMLLTTCAPGDDAGAQVASTPLALIREVAELCPLAPLSANESEALLRSVFGDAEHLPGLALRAHQLSGGNPRALMTLAEHLVDRGVARYEAGSWTLPAALPEHALPESLTAALHARIAALPEPARELGRCLALTDLALLAPPNLARLLAQGDTRRQHAALDALLASGVLISAGQRFRFAQPELAQALRDGGDPAHERALHAQLALALAGTQDPLREAHHLALGGREHDAIALVLPRIGDAENLRFSRFSLLLLERLYLAAVREGLPLLERNALRSGLLAVAALLGEREHFTRHAEPMLAELLQASGLNDYAELADVPEEQRLAAALTRLQERFDAAPAAERGMPAVEAITALARLYSMYVSIAVNAQELGFLEPLPPLTPLAPLSPALGVVQALVDGMRAFLAGRYNHMRDVYRVALQRIEQPDRAGLDAAHYATARLGLRYLQGVFAAAVGRSDAVEWVAPLAEHPGHRVNGLRVHTALALMLGDLETASECRRKADLLALQDGGQVPFPGSTERITLIAQMHAEDIVSIKRACLRIEHSAAEHAGWKATLAFARGQYLRLTGDPEAALEHLLPALAATRAGRQIDWPWLAALHVQLLVALGRFSEAAEHGEAYYARCLELGIDPGHRFVVPHLVAALCALGRHEHAWQLAERSVREEEEEGGGGAPLVVQLEATARAALGLGDGPRFRELVERCKHEHRRGRNRALRARLLRLLDEARARGLGAFVPEPEPGPRSIAAAAASRQTITTGSSSLQTSSTAPSAFERLSGCLGTDERKLELAKLVLEATGAEQCWLFALSGGSLELVAAAPDAAAPPALAALLERHVRAQLQNDDTLTAVLADLPTTTLGSGGATRDGTPEPLILQLERDGQHVVVGAAALRFGESRNPLPDRGALEAVAAVLLDDDRADCVTRCQ